MLFGMLFSGVLSCAVVWLPLTSVVVSPASVARSVPEGPACTRMVALLPVWSDVICRKPPLEAAVTPALRLLMAVAIVAAVTVCGPVNETVCGAPPLMISSMDQVSPPGIAKPADRSFVPVSCAAVPSEKPLAVVSTCGSGPLISAGRLPWNETDPVGCGGSVEFASTWMSPPEADWTR